MVGKQRGKSIMDTLLEKDELIKAVQGNEIGSGNAECFFCDVQTDSRNVSQDSKVMFVPLLGEFQDGHKFIPSVLEKKPGVILLNESEYQKKSVPKSPKSLPNSTPDLETGTDLPNFIFSPFTFSKQKSAKTSLDGTQAAPSSGI